MSASNPSDEKYVKRCSEDIVQLIHRTIEQLQPKHSNTNSNSLHQNSVLNTGIYSFTLSKEQETDMDILRVKIERTIDKYYSSMGTLGQKYLLEFLVPYHFNEQQKRFTTSFSMDSLYPFECTLRGASASFDAFQAAWNGDVPSVRDFVQNYPTFKDRPGLHGTTLLYSAARNNHFPLVQYLVEKGQCSVNAQNLQELDKALRIDDGKYRAYPSAASTPLHAACFRGHLGIVEYLIGHGADYFIQNQVEETPIDNGKRQDNIRAYFENFLVLSYSRGTGPFPKEPIKEKCSEDAFDSVWEYKPFEKDHWTLCTPKDAEQLNRSLLVKDDEEMEQKIYFVADSVISHVSPIIFLRSEENKGKKNHLSWVRCRGSSIWNFDCYAVWQIMLTKHRNVHTNHVPSLKAFQLPEIFDSRFRIQTNCWYNCPAEVNLKMDHTMNYRRKIYRLKIDPIADEPLTFNFQSFTFTNDEKTIFGYIRWLPKLVSRSESSMKKFQFLDNFENLSQRDPIPYTTNMSREKSKPNSDHVPDDDADDLVSSPQSNLDDEGDDDEFPQDATENRNANNGDWSIHDLKNKDNNDDDDDDDTQSIHSDDSRSEGLNDYLDSASRGPQSVSTFHETKSAVDHKQLFAIRAELEKKAQMNHDLEEQLKRANEHMNKCLQESKEKSEKQKQDFENLREKIRFLNNEQQKLLEEKNHLQNIEKAIISNHYHNVESEIVQDFLTPRYSSILDYLKLTKIPLKNCPLDNIVKMSFQQTARTYTVTLVGFDAHHQRFKAILTQIRYLLRLQQSAKQFYQKKSDKITNSVKRILLQVRPRTQLWKEYHRLLLKLFNDQSQVYVTAFDKYINEIAKSLPEQMIFNDSNGVKQEIFSKTEDFMKKHSLLNQSQTFKEQALEQFIKENVLLQKNHLEKQPTKKSISTLEYFIEKIRNTLKTNAQFHGHEVKHYNQIPSLLQRLMIYYCSFKIQLPLFESAEELLSKIEHNVVTTIATSTGSGKSTLLPALLAAEGYDKILVTQPRRLPCTLIAERVNETMTTGKDSLSSKFAGWAVSGANSNPNAQVLYLTDGLLKEYLLYDENFIRRDTNINKSVVFFIDEVHERSVNIDHCLALLARILKIHPDLRLRMKIIISSATLDKTVPALFRQISDVKLSEFQMPQMGTLYPVTKCFRPNENVLNIVQELYVKERRRYDQILCFVSSVFEVTECCRLLKDITGGAIIAYPLIQSQQASEQQTFIDHGSVFFSTTVAETSLTFPQLKYVVDTGFINIPVYDPKSKRTILQTVRAAESTIKQRLGRLGRTQPGTYFALYDFKVEDKPFPTAQICQSDLMNIEFSLRKSPLKKGLNYMKEFFPDKPSQQTIDHTIKELKQLGILTDGPGEPLTAHGQALAKLPDFGSLAMSKCVLAALKTFHCGRDLIILSSILGVLNMSNILKAIPDQYKSVDGDFMTLINVLDDILLMKQTVSAKEFSLRRICEKQGLTKIQHNLRQALRRYSTLQRAFDLSVEYRKEAQVQSKNWESIAKSL
ncbi:unnamed protein product, partial [Adineta ricciae]